MQLRADAIAIERGEDRLAFKETMNRLGIELAKSEISHSVEEAEKIAEELSFLTKKPSDQYLTANHRNTGCHLSTK